MSCLCSMTRIIYSLKQKAEIFLIHQVTLQLLKELKNLFIYRSKDMYLMRLSRGGTKKSIRMRAIEMYFTKYCSIKLIDFYPCLIKKSSSQIPLIYRMGKICQSNIIMAKIVKQTTCYYQISIGQTGTYNIIIQTFSMNSLTSSDKISKNRLGIMRSRFNDYLKYKGRRSLAKKRFSKNSLKKTIDDDDITQSTLLNYSTKTSEIQLTQMYEPAWMDDYKKCCMILVEVDSIMEDIRLQKAKKMTAVNQQKHKRTIQKYYSQAGSKIQQCERIFKNIQKLTNIENSPQQRKIFTNTLMSLAMKTRERAKEIRSAQQQDLRERRQLQKFQINKYDGQNLMNKDIDEDGWTVSQEGFHALQQQLSNQRNEQILKIVASIHSLNTIYKQLQSIVIEQGSLLDRIDENITTAAVNVKEANQQLTKAEQHQKSPVAKRIMVVLLLLIVIFTLILAFR